MAVLHKPKMVIILQLPTKGGRLPFSYKLRSSSIYLKIGVVFNLAKYCRSSSIYLNIEVVFHFAKNEGRLPFSKIWGRLPFAKNLRSSSSLDTTMYYTPVSLLGHHSLRNAVK